MHACTQSTSAHLSTIALPRREQNVPRVPQLGMGRYLSPQGSPYVLCQSCLSNISASRRCVRLKRSECQRDCFHLLTYLLTHSLTHALTHSRTHALTYSLTHLLTYSLTHSRTHSFTYLLTCLLASLLTYLPVCLLAYLHT